jgi:hypothetical protein
MLIDMRMSSERMDDQAIARQVDRLVEEYRVSCLWFMPPDYFPATLTERMSVLRHIERHGDREAFRRAATLRRWLSAISSAASAGS